MPQLTGALLRPETTPTAPLPSAAVKAMRRLELAFAAPATVRAVTRYEVGSARTAELSAVMDKRSLSGAEFDSLALAQDTMADARTTLAAGQLHLIEVAR